MLHCRNTDVEITPTKIGFHRYVQVAHFVYLRRPLKDNKASLQNEH